MRVAPSMMCADFRRLEEEVRALEAGGADLLHWDVMDGQFVPNITFGPMVIRAARPETKLPFCAHLMIAEPDRHLAEFIEAGADLVCVHIEACRHPTRLARHVRELGARPGIALNPATPCDMVEHVLDEVAFVLVMSVDPGFAGQAFIPAVVPKVETLRKMIDDRGIAVEIEVDGGVSTQNAGMLARAGANILVAGSALFKQAPGYAAAIARLKSACERG